MRIDGRAIHFGINFVFTPPPAIDRLKHLEFQKTLVESGIDVGQAQFLNQKIMITANEPAAFQIILTTPGPQIGQLLFVAQQQPSLELFVKNIEASTAAFEKVWKGPRQIIGRDATIRKLFQSTDDHAFKELWEKRLGRKGTDFAPLDRPVLGGGLRLVMPPKEGESEPVLIEVKIESSLQDSKNFFVETQMNWPQPTSGISFDVGRRLKDLDFYIKDNVVPFIIGEA